MNRMPLTNQTAFEQAIIGLFEQNEKAYDPDEDRCWFRAPNGCKCAVGFIIPDDIYHPEMENYHPSSLKKRYPELEAYWRDVDDDLLSELQDIHDFYTPDRWREKFEHTARSWNLTLEKA